MDIPRKLNRDGRSLNYTGAGRTAGAHCFVDAKKNEILEIFEATVFSSGANFSLARVSDNEALDSVYVGRDARNGHGRPANGDTVLIGPVSFPGGKPRARNVWPLSRRRTGVVIYVADGGTWGKLAAEQPGLDEVFVHRSKLEDGRLFEGARFSFVVVDDPRGPAAHAVRPA